MAVGVGLVYDERMCAHKSDTDPNHPERPTRISSIYDRLKSAGIVERCVKVDARMATTEELTSVHTEKHVVLMQDISSTAYGKQGRKSMQNRYNSIYFNSGSSESALLAAGSVIEVATQVAEGKLAAGACVVRPPGHHAEAGEAMGFCLFNNVAIAGHILTHKKEELGVQKLLIVDWDVHHGNGTQHMFWNDPQVLYFSVHRFDDGTFYPPGYDGDYNKVGVDDGEGYNINVPWPHGGFGDADYLAAWEYVLMPVAHEYKPDIVLISAGFDSALGDPLGECEVTPGAYFKMTQQLMELAKGRVVLALEGGYNLASISESYLACMQALLGDPCPIRPCGRDLLPATLPLLEKVRKELEKFWPVLKTTMKALQPVPPTPAPSLAAEEISKLILEEELSLMSGERRKERMGERQSESQADLTDLLGLLSKLSTGDGVVIQTANSNEPTSSIAAAQARAEASGEASFSEATGPELVMKEIKQGDIQVILDLSGANSPSKAGTSKRPIRRLKGGDGEDFKFIRGMAFPCKGCRDTTPAVASDWMIVPNRLFFGHESTDMWGLGGVAFMDPVPEAGVSTHIRLYKITMEQFNDVLSQENQEILGKIWIDDIHIDALRKGPPTTPNHLIDLGLDDQDDWYGTVKYFGEKDSAPILTCTCSEFDVGKFMSGEFVTAAPSASYRAVIARGLIGDLGLTEEQAADYLSSATLPTKKHNA